MIRKSSLTAFKTIMGGILFASVIAIGCNSSGDEKKESTPADSSTTAPAPAAADTGAAKMDTAATKPVVTPN